MMIMIMTFWATHYVIHIRFIYLVQSVACRLSCRLPIQYVTLSRDIAPSARDVVSHSTRANSAHVTVLFMPTTFKLHILCSTMKIMLLLLLADRTARSMIDYWHDNVAYRSVCPSVCQYCFARLTPCHPSQQLVNKMPCYRKDDRAMRPIAYMGGLKIFESPCIATPI